MVRKSMWTAPGVRIAAVLALSCTAVFTVGVGDAGAKGGGGAGTKATSRLAAGRGS